MAGNKRREARGGEEGGGSVLKIIMIIFSGLGTRKCTLVIPT